MKLNEYLTLEYTATFMAVCRAGGIRAAAEEIGTGPTAVSRKFGLLEQSLDVQLALKNKRHFKLTPAGAQLRDSLMPAFTELESVLTNFEMPVPADEEAHSVLIDNPISESSFAQHLMSSAFPANNIIEFHVGGVRALNPEVSTFLTADLSLQIDGYSCTVIYEYAMCIACTPVTYKRLRSAHSSNNLIRIAQKTPAVVTRKHWRWNIRDKYGNITTVTPRKPSVAEDYRAAAAKVHDTEAICFVPKDIAEQEGLKVLSSRDFFAEKRGLMAHVPHDLADQKPILKLLKAMSQAAQHIKPIIALEQR